VSEETYESRIESRIEQLEKDNAELLRRISAIEKEVILEK